MGILDAPIAPQISQALKLPRRRERPTAAIAALTIDKVMASPPTIGAPVTISTISGGKDWNPLKAGITTGDATALDPAAPFDVVGASAARQQGSTYPSYGYVVYDSPAHPNAQSATYRNRFHFDGTNLEIKMSIYASTPWQIYVDGQAVSASAFTLGVNQTVSFIPLTFASRAPRLIEVVSSNPFGGVRTAPTDTVWKPAPLGGPRCIILGDSYTGGTGADASGISGWAQKLAALMGWPDTWAAGVGGSGYLNAGQGSTFRSRVTADITANKPDIVIVAGGHNDASNTAAAIQTEAGLLFDAIKAGCPKAKLIVVGPMGAQNAQGNYATIQAAIFAAAAGKADLTIDTLNPNWFTGVGFIGTNRTVTDGVTTSGSTTITSATAGFVSGDVNRVITGAGIPAGAKISSVTNSTTAVLSTAANASASPVTMALTNQRGDGNDDYYTWTDNIHPSQAGHDYIARRIASVTTGWLAA
jgi:lysophospholipase L1-like esterase